MFILFFLFLSYFQINLSCNEISPFSLVYHGSNVCFEIVEARPNTRIDSEGNIAWQGEAIFTSPDYRIALFYTHNKVDSQSYQASIDLISQYKKGEPITYAVFGGESMDDALEALFGIASDECNGYIYLLDANFAFSEEGLGKKEQIIISPNAQIGRVELNRRSHIDRLIELGQVRILWRSTLF